MTPGPSDKPANSGMIEIKEMVEWPKISSWVGQKGSKLGEFQLASLI